MKHEKFLSPGERWDVPANARYVSYVSGPGEIEVYLANEQHILDVGENLRADDVFDGLTIRNDSGTAGNVVIKTGTGSIYTKGDGQVVEITRIAETVAVSVAQTLKTEITNQIAASIVGNVGVTQAGAWAVTAEQKAARSLNPLPAVTFVNAGDSHTVAANANRRDLVIMAGQENTGTVTVGGLPLKKGQPFSLDDFSGSVTATADTAGDKIFITEVIK